VSILELGDLSLGELTEVGYFDTYPADEDAQRSGALGIFPFFASGTVISNDTCGVLYILTPDLI
jgi:hypothetical protein